MVKLAMIFLIGVVPSECVCMDVEIRDFASCACQLNTYVDVFHM